MLVKTRFVTSLGILVLMSLSGGARTHKYLWLEDVSGARATAWVKAENERSAKVLQSDPRFAGLAPPSALVNGNDIYNTWQDAEHVRGILRRTSLADYLTSQPHWHTVLDYDALGKQDNRRWVHKGLTCLYPENELAWLRSPMEERMPSSSASLI